MPKQRMPQPEKKKGDASTREGAGDMNRENPRRENPGGMPDRQGMEREQNPHWRREGEGDQNE